MTNATDRRNGLIGELGIKKPVRVATTANITLSALQTIDGVTVVEGDRVLVKNQTTASENGIYDASSGSWTRSLDFDGNQDVTDGTIIYVRAGTTQLKQFWAVSATNPITIGTTSISFIYTISFGDAGLVAANNLLDVPNKATARDNMGLEIGVDIQAQNVNLSALAGLTGAANNIPQFTGTGAMSLLSIGTASGNVPLVGTQSATTSLAGTIEIATDAEVIAGTDTTRAATAAAIAALFGTSILGDTGELKIPLIVGGVFVKGIIKYGVANNVTSSGATVTFANAFPNAMRRAFLTPFQFSSGTVNPATASVMAGANTFTTTSFFISNTGSTETRDWQWMAIGY